jgi:hypothetical protein
MIEETVEQVVEETPVEDTIPVEQEAAPAQQSAKDKDSNLRILRQTAERASHERDEAIERLRKLEASRAQPEEPDEDIQINSDDLIEGKHLKKVVARYEKKFKQLEEQQRQSQQQAAESSAISLLRSQYADFDKVVTLENVQAFSAAYPEMAKSINSASDIYDKAVSAYTLIKKFNIYEETPFDSEKQRAIANSIKPRPLSSVSPQQGDNPLSRANAFANGLTEELKTQLLKEMNAYRKAY